MIAVAVIVFISLHFVKAGYGIFQNKKWGATINNRIGWMLMESPVFIAMFAFLLYTPNEVTWARLAIFGIFQLHYLQRAFIFPFLIKGNSRMPLSVMFMGVFFNLLNAIMQGYWLFFESYKFENMYSNAWLISGWFIVGAAIFLLGFVVNLRSDYIIRHLRKSPTDTKHYLPKAGMFNYVTSANYFGELLEWLGFTVLTCSLAGFTFFIWTFANLVPRAKSIHNRYKEIFADEMAQKRLKAVFPFIY
jgi:3-oxo-5-alpha-steroid 4-dehydrogenase 1